MIPRGKSLRIVLSLIGRSRARVVEYALSYPKRATLQRWVNKPLDAELPAEKENVELREWLQGCWAQTVRNGCNLTKSKSPVVMATVWADQYASDVQYPILDFGELPENVMCMPPLGAGRLVRGVGHTLLEGGTLIVSADEFIDTSVSFCVELNARKPPPDTATHMGEYLLEPQPSGLTFVEHVNLTGLNSAIRDMCSYVGERCVRGVGISGNCPNLVRDNLNGSSRLLVLPEDDNTTKRLNEAVILGAAERAIRFSGLAVPTLWRSQDILNGLPLCL